MKAGTENRNKTIIAAVLGVAALIFVGYNVYNAFFSGPSTPPPTPAASTTSQAASERNAAINSASTTTTTKPVVNTNQAAIVPGVEPQLIASTKSSLDPTLDEAAMLRTESLVYTGAGRNIFSLIYIPPPPPQPINVPNPRTTTAVVAPPPPPTPPPTCPPTCPAIPLKFFGTVKGSSMAMRAFLLDGEDVYLASQGDIVAHKYKIVSIATASIQIEDLSNHNTQTLPLQQQ